MRKPVKINFKNHLVSRLAHCQLFPCFHTLSLSPTRRTFVTCLDLLPLVLSCRSTRPCTHLSNAQIESNINFRPGCIAEILVRSPACGYANTDSYLSSNLSAGPSADPEPAFANFDLIIRLRLETIACTRPCSTPPRKSPLDATSRLSFLAKILCD